MTWPLSLRLRPVFGRVQATTCVRHALDFNQPVITFDRCNGPVAITYLRLCDAAEGLDGSDGSRYRPPQT